MLSSILKGAAGSLSTYEFGNSYDFGATNTTKAFTRAFGSGGNQDKWTLSMWFKAADLTYIKMFFSSGIDIDDYAYIQINSVERILYFTGRGGGIDEYVYTGTSLINSTSTWYHLTVAYDPTQGVNAAKCAIYLNNLFKTAVTASVPTTTYGYINQAITHAIGTRTRGSSGFDSFFRGKLADIHFIDGQYLSPSDFAEDVGGVWTPKQYTGTYGTTGFRLNFADTTSATTLGYDVSGNGNNWTPTAAITTADVSTDIP